MPDKTDNHLPNPNFTQHHEEKIEKIDAMEKDVANLKSAVYGSEKPHIEGLEKQVKALEDGYYSKLLSRQNTTIIVSIITCLALVVGAVITVVSFSGNN